MSIKSKIGKITRFLGNPDFYRYFFYNVGQLRKLNRSPVILCGCPRSGTTLLMSLLDSHPEIHVIPFETAVLQHRLMDRRLFRSDGLHRFFTHFQLSLYLFSGRIKPTANRWCEKTPLNILNVDEIRRIFKNEVRFINLVRDGRDVVSSYHKRLGYMVKPSLWLRCVEAGQKETDNNDFITVHYEHIVNNPEMTLENLQKFLDLDKPFAIQEWTMNTSINSNRSLVNGKEMVYQVAEINKKSMGKWKASSSPWLTEFLNNETFLKKNSELGYD